MADENELTGNDYVSLPAIGADGSLDGVNVLHGGLAGLVEWLGDGSRALLQPTIRVGGNAVPLVDLRWRRLDRWIPTFTVSLADGLSLTGTICAPGGYPAARGFIVRLQVDNTGRAPVDVVIALDIAWAWSRHWIATARPLSGPNRLSADADGSSVLMETDGGRGPALAITTGGEAVLSAAAAGADLERLDGQVGLEQANGSPLYARLEQHLTVTPQRRASADFFAGVGRERDGAFAAARSIRRTGSDALLRQARLELSYTLRSGQDHRWADMLNRNLLFNRFFAAGRAVDDDRLYLVRSRSTRCPQPALFNEREALFWTVPALMLADPGLAREALHRVFDLFSERSGEYVRYIDGGDFDTGFALDQFLLYPWIVQHYVAVTGDESLLDEPLIRQVVQETDGSLFMRLHPQQMLCSTDLLPSGDRADHAYSTYGNVLVWSLCEALPRLLPDAGTQGEPPPRFAGAGAEVAAGIWQHCVAELEGAPVFASSADLDGETAIYDDPEGSLALLPFLGFCNADDPVWTATMEFLRGPRYPLWRDGVAPGICSRSDPDRARLAALCADLLGPAAGDALQRLLRIGLPGGIAASAYDPATGAATEPHHAALAGFLAWALVRAAEPPDAGKKARRRRR
jgi:uncharacterized protein